MISENSTAPNWTPSRTPTAKSEAPIEFRGLHKLFGQTHAVNDVTFEVNAGEVFGYIGPNGAGKTTSMRILATLEEPTAGDAYVDGFSVVEDPDRVRSRLGFMPDYFGAYQNVSVWEYLDFFSRAYGLRGNERREALGYVMDFTGLDALANKPIDGLSKGMKQRLCLGRTMIHDPSVMVLDEPAAGLDPRARIELREMISRLAELGKAILISSHILTELAEICDRVAIIEHGTLIAVGSVDEISSRAEQSESLGVRVKVIGEASGLAGWLERRPDTEQVRWSGDTVSFVEVSGEKDGQVQLAEMLAEMVNSGFRVIEFSSRTRSLEDVFLHVTKGRVQ